MKSRWPLHPFADASPLITVLCLVVLTAIFFRASNAPIDPLDTWSHWKYGEWIWNHSRFPYLTIPSEEPFSPYSDLPLVDTMWLSQVSCYLAYAWAGMEGIALLYALIEVLKGGLYLLAYRRVSGSLCFGLAGVVFMEAGRWTYFGVIRPQTIGEVCWAGLLLACARPRLSRAAVIGVPLCIGLWANLHGSFLFAYVLLGTMLASRYLRQAWLLSKAKSQKQERPLKTQGDGERAGIQRGLSNALDDSVVRRLALVLVLSLAAACINPYGPRLFVEIIRFGKIESLQDVKEWLPMVPLSTYGGYALVASFILVMITLRWSRRRFRLPDMALLMIFGAAAWFSARMLPWWMTIWPYVLLPHWRRTIRVSRSGRWAVGSSPNIECGLRNAEAGSRLISRIVYIVGILAAAGMFFYSGTGLWLLRGYPRPVEQQFTKGTPVALVEQLKAWRDSADGQVPMSMRVFTSPLWADYLLWTLSNTHKQTSVYWYSHWNCFSLQRMREGHHLLMLKGPPSDWQSIVNRYRLNVLVLQLDEPLARHLLAEERRSQKEADDRKRDSRDQVRSEWQIIFRDLQGPSAGLVAVRHIDPFLIGLTQADLVQGCVGNLGSSLCPSQWSILSHLPWYWDKKTRIQTGIRGGI